MELIQYYRREKSKDQRVKKSKTQDKNHQIFKFSNHFFKSKKRMRVVAELPHPDCKISIFSMNMKYLIKFEQGTLEQTYKLSEMDVLNGIDGVFEILDEAFISAVVKRFTGMRKDFIEAYKRYN